MEAVRRVCKAWPLAPLEGTRAGTLARRAAVEWQSASDNVANHIMKDWPAETAAVAIAAAYAPKLEPGERIATASEDSLSDNTQSEEGSESEDDGEVLDGQTLFVENLTDDQWKSADFTIESTMLTPN